MSSLEFRTKIIWLATGVLTVHDRNWSCPRGSNLMWLQEGVFNVVSRLRGSPEVRRGYLLAADEAVARVYNVLALESSTVHSVRILTAFLCACCRLRCVPPRPFPVHQQRVHQHPVAVRRDRWLWRQEWWGYRRLRWVSSWLNRRVSPLKSMRGLFFRARRFQTVHSPNLFEERCVSEVVRIDSIIICHLSRRWKEILCDVIFLVRLQGKFETDRSWEWKGKCPTVSEMKIAGVSSLDEISY